MDPRRSPDPRRRSEQSRRAILQAAWELCRRHGYAALSIDSIAAEAGVGKQTIYRWWPSKGAVAADAVMELLRPRLQTSRTGSFEADMRRQLRAVVALMREPALGRIIAELVGEAQWDAALAGRIVDQIVRPLRELNRESIALAQRAGHLRPDLDPELAADLLFGPMWLRFLVSKAPLSDAYADATLDAALAGLREPREPRRAPAASRPR